MEHILAAAVLLASGLGVEAGQPLSFPGEGIELRGLVYRPPGRGPFPAIVLTHGRGGLWNRQGMPSASHVFWVEHFRKEGFIALHIDSFGPSGRA